jgi:general secretion pathway protein L
MANGFSHRSLFRNGLEGLNRALDWWFFELGEILQLVNRFKKQNILEFEVSAEGKPTLSSGDITQNPGSLRNVRLKLDGNRLLYRKIQLPAAARKNIARVVSYEFNKYFPINAEDALFSCTVTPPDTGAASIEIEIWAVSRALIDAYLSMIQRQHQIEIRNLAITNGDGQALITRDIEKERRMENQNRHAASARVLNIIIAGLLLVLIVYPVKRMDVYLEQQQQEIARLEKQAQPIIELRQKIMATDKRFRSLVDTKKESPDQAYLWSYLTRSISNQVILYRIEIDGRNVRVSGKTGSVESLLRSLESNQRVTDVKITGPVKAADDNLYETLKLILTIRS